MKRSLEQLRSQTWQTQAEATKELKRNGFSARGADYELRETASGSWQVMPIDDDADQSAPPAPKAAAAKRASPRKAEQAKPEPEPEPKPEPEPQPVSKPALPVGADLSLLPSEHGPYALVVLAEDVGQDRAHTDALDASRLLKRPVWAQGASGKLIRVFDHQVYRDALKAGRKPRAGSTAVVGAKGPKGTGKTADVAALLFREGGATKAEMVAITDWSFGARYIHRIAGSYGASVEELGENHWRLVKAD